MIPGRGLHRLAIALCSPDMRERVIDAFLADFQREWLDAVGRRCRAFAVARGYGWFVVTLVQCLVFDAKHDFAGFAARVLKPMAVVSLGLATPVALSWVSTGYLDWIDAARRLGLTGSLAAAFLIARYRSQYAECRSLPPFFLALGVAVTVLIFHPVNDGQPDVYQWLYLVALTLAWPFLMKKNSSVSRRIS